MGKYEDNTPIKWLIIGTDNNGEIKALTVQDHEELEQGKLTEEKQYYVLSEKVLEARVFDADSHEYATSDMRAYLTSEEFTTKYSITQADLDKIQARSLQQIYEKDTISYTDKYYDEELGEFISNTSSGQSINYYSYDKNQLSANESANAVASLSQRSL